MAQPGPVTEKGRDWRRTDITSSWSIQNGVERREPSGGEFWFSPSAGNFNIPGATAVGRGGEANNPARKLPRSPKEFA
jgi:hypothetical protein